MRTTVTLDPDLDARLKALASERRQSLKATINAAIRAGLAMQDAEPRQYRELVVDLGVRPGLDLTKALQLAAALEDSAIVEKVALRK